MLQKKGVPGIVERTLIRPPSSQLGPISTSERSAFMANSEMGLRYDKTVDRHSAFEILKSRAEEAAREAERAETEAENATQETREFNTARRYSGKSVPRSTSRRSSRSPDTLGEALTKAVVRELGGTTGRRLVRGILGGLFRGR